MLPVSAHHRLPSAASCAEAVGVAASTARPPSRGAIGAARSETATTGRLTARHPRLASPTGAVEAGTPVCQTLPGAAAAVTAGCPPGRRIAGGGGGAGGVGAVGSGGAHSVGGGGGGGHRRP